MAVLQVNVQGFRQVDERGLGRPVSQPFGQAAVTRHTADQTDMARLARDHAGQHGTQHLHGPHVVDLVVLQHFRDAVLAGPQFLVVTGAVQHQVQRAAGQYRLGSGLHGVGVGDIKGHGNGPRMLGDKGLQRVGVAGRHKQVCTGGMQCRSGGFANAAGRANQPDRLAMPVGDEGVERHSAVVIQLSLKMIAVQAVKDWTSKRFYVFFDGRRASAQPPSSGEKFSV